jgi:hypothetical protein
VTASQIAAITENQLHPDAVIEEAITNNTYHKNQMIAM